MKFEDLTPSSASVSRHKDTNRCIDLSFRASARRVISVGLKVSITSRPKGNIEWVPATNSVKKRRLSWERFAELMESQGNIARMK